MDEHVRRRSGRFVSFVKITHTKLHFRTAASSISSTSTGARNNLSGAHTHIQLLPLYKHTGNDHAVDPIGYRVGWLFLLQFSPEQCNENAVFPLPFNFKCNEFSFPFFLSRFFLQIKPEVNVASKWLSLHG